MHVGIGVQAGRGSGRYGVAGRYRVQTGIRMHAGIGVQAGMGCRQLSGAGKKVPFVNGGLLL